MGSALMRFAAIAAVAVLAACGGGGAGDGARAPGIPARFGDYKPHEWSGRAPASYAVHGVDASRWNGAVDWGAAARSGVSFAWFKATEGGDRVDPLYAVHVAGAEAAGIPVGAYHFYYICGPADAQARWFIANVPRKAGMLPPVLDIEYNPVSPTCRIRPPADQMRDEIATFQRIVERHFGQRPVIYTTLDFWHANDLGRMDEEFWLRSVAGHPEEKYPGADWSFWQYSGTGRVDGFAGHVDLNAFTGSREAWDGWLRRRRL